MKSIRGRATSLVLILTTAILSACGGDESEPGDSAANRNLAAKVSISAGDYGFEVPETIPGGLIEISFRNDGKEPHFAGLARVLPGRTFEDVRDALSAPAPPGPSSGPAPAPPPFEDVAGMPTTDPGRDAKLTVNLAPGTYALFCSLPSPDGHTHAEKGMVKKLTVTGGTPGELGPTAGTIVATDFALTPPPALRAGPNEVRFRNEGRQLHEMNLVELAPGKTVEDVVRWYRQPSGPPPMLSMGGVAVKPGSEGTATLQLRSESTYAFVCVISDVLGDFAPHVVKGMFTKALRVE